MERGSLQLPSPSGSASGAARHTLAPTSGRRSPAPPLVSHAHARGVHGLCGLPSRLGFCPTHRPRRGPASFGPAPRPRRTHTPTPAKPPPRPMTDPVDFAKLRTDQCHNCQHVWGQASIKTVNTGQYPNCHKHPWTGLARKKVRWKKNQSGDAII